MSLAPGTKLGPFEIQTLLGAGGMGEVYRARDSRLDRTVAIKLLPSKLAANSESRQRLEREARSLSKLSHPHICALYDIGYQDGTDFLVMEYVEGETLEQRLLKGPLSIEQVFKIAIEICDALDKAHQQGVIHRDLKPGNIMLTKSGAKLLDFGLAKLMHLPTSVEVALTEMTAERKLTAEGVLVGTLQYMAPEQLEGKEADARTDIFALGEITYEMTTGRPPFSGKSKASLIAAILSSEPPEIASLQPMTPAALTRVVKACLAKDPADRFQTAHDLKLQLQWLAEADSQAFAPARVRAATRKWAALAWALVVVLPLLAVVIAASYFRSRQTSPKRVLAFIPAPEKATIELEGDSAGPAVISPDGGYVVFVASAGGRRQIWLRATDAPNSQALPDTGGASFPFWSPDSRSMGFFANGTLKRLDLTSGTAFSLCEAPSGRGASWGKDGVIVFAPEFRTGLFRVSASGGMPVPITTVDSSKHSSHRWPYFLPDGKHFLYLAVSHGAPTSPNTAVYVSSIDGKENQMLVRSVANPVYSSGYLLFMRENTLMAQRFDPDRLRLDGEPVLVATAVRNDISTWHAAFDASGELLAYQTGKYTDTSQLIWLDRSGKEIGTLGASDMSTGRFKGFRISPQADKVAIELGDPADIWIYDISRGVRTRFTFGPGIEQLPVWSPDGSQIIYSSDQHGHQDLYRKAANGGGTEELLLESNRLKEPDDWSADGRYLLYAQEGDIWALPLFGERKPFPVVQSPFFESLASFSRDGQWVAYSSDESGTTEIYVVPFSPPESGAATNSRGGKWQVSTSGGVLPFWRRDGKELLYTDLAETSIMSAEITTTGPEFKSGTAHQLFKLPHQKGVDMTADGKRFLIKAVGQEPPAPMTVLTNWTSGLSQK